MINSLKSEIHQQCIDIINKQIDEIKLALNNAQEGANNETKSSAGDKHETGRAMAQLETEKLSTQLNKNEQLLTQLFKIDTSAQLQKIGVGSLVKTNNGLFYIAIGLGKINIEEESVFVISTQSPIGKLLLNKKEKVSFSFNNVFYSIEKID